MKILLLEDETILKESIEEFLKSKNYHVDSYENSDDAFDAIFTIDYDLLLLDVNVPGEWDGFSLRKELSIENKNIPTIFVTSMSSADAMLQGYAHGCCDYIKKPFDLIELLLRVQHALKSNCFKTDETFIKLPQGYNYNVTTYELTHNEQRVALSKTEGDILNLFLLHRNRVVTTEMLHEQIWQNSVSSANARVQINNLRRKLPKEIIKNIYGLGYRLDC
ncbi:response regulator [Sulfurimonas aquatica]|uniref:Response regulator n=1 Tax=Sulfurimonas aquatica TaxID=2672570 RepID=A0A975AZ11_9BACT|nr:response regulator transcription factor [Sulfurimonas aquatica]QSZ41159.1 response regulator [Sulfurimonas aquatica]